MSELRCYIWNTVGTEFRHSGGQTSYIDSPRAGGRYGITDTAIALIKDWNDEDRTRLTTWLCNQREAGITCPIITSDLLNDVTGTPALMTTERVERALLYLNKKLRVGDTITINLRKDAPISPEAYALMALTESITISDLLALFSLTEEMGLVSVLNVNDARWIGPSARGWLEIEKLQKRLPNSTQAFVAMWFNAATDSAYNNGIAPAIRDSGYRPVRIDNKEHINKIDDEIIAEIRRSKFVVADFSCESGKVRGGVYFEAGFAMGLAIPIIWTCSQSSIGDLHFDTRQYNHIVWESPETLRKLLTARIGAVIGDGPLKNSERE